MQSHFQERARAQPKRQRTRATLLDAAIAVVAQRGVDGATVQEMTRYCGLAQGTFYNHFSDLDELIVSTAKTLLNEIHEHVINSLADLPPGIDRMIQAIERSIERAAQTPEHGRFIVAALTRYPVLHNAVRPKLREDLKAASRNGDIPLRPSLLLDEQLGALVNLAITREIAGSPARKLRDETIKAILRLLGQSPEQAELALRDAKPFARPVRRRAQA